ncbi:MAG: transposase domain-containing protein [Pseudonocardiaceae bacterium]
MPKDAKNFSPRSGRLTDHIAVGVLSGLIHRDIVDDVINACGKREQRSRLLPAHVVVYYVLALNLFFGEAYEEVMRQLVNGLRFLGNWRNGWKVPTTSALSPARNRLGEAPLRLLFERIAVPMARAGARGAWFRGLRVMAIDGLVLDVPDTPANDEAFGRSGNVTAPSPFPQVRLVALGECGTHAVVDAAFGPVTTGEQTLAAQLIARFTAGMLVLADRNLCATRRSIAFPVQPGGIGGSIPGPDGLPDFERKLGDKSMPGNRWSRPGEWSDAPGGPHDMAKAVLPEPQSPVVSRSHPPESHLKPAPSPCARIEVARRNLPEADNVQ